VDSSALCGLLLVVELEWTYDNFGHPASIGHPVALHTAVPEIVANTRAHRNTYSQISLSRTRPSTGEVGRHLQASRDRIGSPKQLRNGVSMSPKKQGSWCCRLHRGQGEVRVKNGLAYNSCGMAGTVTVAGGAVLAPVRAGADGQTGNDAG
jgi:hypothetical protein